MSKAEYTKALAAGRADYRSKIARGEYPYLPVLEKILKNVPTESEVPLGIVKIPADRIVGTYSEGRSNSFASNFMPLLEENSEFAYKWTLLEEAHTSEGIRDPIKAVEYLNNFYVVEGNKRVSVLKSCGAVEIMGEVTRILPQKNNSRESRLYYEFVSFYRNSKINFIWFTKLGSFEKLEGMILGTENPKEFRPWTDEERNDLHTLYVMFEKAFLKAGGKKLPITTGDALLSYLEVHPFSKARTQVPQEVEQELKKMWNEILMLKEEDAVDLVLDPLDSSKPGLFSRIFTLPQSLKVTFVNAKSPENSSWTYAHELGRAYVNDALKDRITTEAVNNVTDENAEQVIEKAIKNGSDVIFTTTPRFLNASLKVAVEYPKVHILNCSLNVSHRYIRCYYNRMYEAKFLTGMLAGAMADNNRIAYLADYPITGMISNINAFTLGARMVNPRATVFLEWTTKKNFNAFHFLNDTQVSHVSLQDMSVPSNTDRHFGLYATESRENLAMPVRNWGKVYEEILLSIFNGRFNSEETQSSRALNYLWGMSAGAVDLIYSQRLSEPTQHLIRFMKHQIIKGNFAVFSGPIRDQSGNLRCKEGEVLPVEEIINMNWLTEGVIGQIPAREELNEDAAKLMNILEITS